MRRNLPALLAVALTAALAYPAFAAEPTPEQDAASRAALLKQRAALDAENTARADACYKRFLVNDCLDAQRKSYGEQREAIDNALFAISLRERQKAATAELRRVREQMRQAQLAAPPPDAARAAEEQRAKAEKARIERAAEHAVPPHAPTQRLPHAVPQRASAPRHEPAAAVRPETVPRNPQAGSDAEAAYARKLQDYQHKQREVQKTLDARQPAPPLALPAGQD